MAEAAAGYDENAMYVRQFLARLIHLCRPLEAREGGHTAGRPWEVHEFGVVGSPSHQHLPIASPATAVASAASQAGTAGEPRPDR
ncbi:hypothetical protein, partial [Streptomyces decoyicus]|uniref:hypothetical protein n=1 Tax=Streptomyces decoyicus TaxID=249567 RepID=UPI0033AE30AF